MSDVNFTINEGHLSVFKVILDVTEVPDTENPNLPGTLLRPQHVIVTAYPDQGIWGVSMMLVSGPKVHPTTGNLTKRNYDSPYVDPLDPESNTPEWLAKMARQWQDWLNRGMEQ